MKFQRPCSTSYEPCYRTIQDNQLEIVVVVYQAESIYCMDNLKLGEIAVSVPPVPVGREIIDVRFIYDINGILEIDE